MLIRCVIEGTKQRLLFMFDKRRMHTILQYYSHHKFTTWAFGSTLKWWKHTWFSLHWKHLRMKALTLEQESPNKPASFILFSIANACLYPSIHWLFCISFVSILDLFLSREKKKTKIKDVNNRKYLFGKKEQIKFSYLMKFVWEHCLSWLRSRGSSFSNTWKNYELKKLNTKITVWIKKDFFSCLPRVKLINK